MQRYSPVHSDEIVQVFHLFPFYPLPRKKAAQGTNHLSIQFLFIVATIQ